MKFLDVARRRIAQEEHRLRTLRWLSSFRQSYLEPAHKRVRERIRARTTAWNELVKLLTGSGRY